VTGPTLQVEVGGALTEPARCRDLLRDHVSRHAAAVDVDLVLLLASELVTNAVLHGAAPRRMRFLSDGTAAFRLEVYDGGTGLPVLRPPPTGSQNGRGLQIVQGLTDRWGISPDGDGKTVWVEVHG
jgi:anti-sigma regulatory factor (Ser/Thr protein kinase)